VARTFYIQGQEQLHGMFSWMRKLDLDKPWEVLVKPYKDRRSPEANKRYWAILGQIAMETGHDKDEIHEFCKQKFLGDGAVVLAGEKQPVARSSSKLKTDEFTHYVEQVEAWAATTLGVVIE